MNSEAAINIKILFQQMPPELLNENIWRWMTKLDGGTRRLADSEHISEDCYRRLAHGVSEMQRMTEDEIKQRHIGLSDTLNRHPRGGVFALLAEQSNIMLNFQGGNIYCRIEHMLDWRDLWLAMGQDLFVCAGLAAKDVRQHSVSRFFQWPTIIPTDHVELRRVLERGIAENHYHLNGSTQIFPLVWSFLMNHPEEIKNYFKNPLFASNLHSSISHGADDNQMPWWERIEIAAWIRATLFSVIYGELNQKSVLENYLKFIIARSSRMIDLCSKVGRLRIRHGARLSQREGDKICLDYAITPKVLENNPPNAAVRLLTGERSFLYQSFEGCFSDRFSKEVCDLFYLYLSIKSHFRSELVQNNGRRGFRNFADYQDRKDNLLEYRRGYADESYRLSVGTAYMANERGKQCLRSLEMRIMPSVTAKELRTKINYIDQCIGYALEDQFENEEYCVGFVNHPAPDHGHDYHGNRNVPKWKRRKERIKEDANYFYVLHFAKKPLLRLKHANDKHIHERNFNVRNKVKIQARAIARALTADDELCSRIRGIDACSHEIGCRPETFATAFRYLRNFSPASARSIGKVRHWPHISATYHAGEDFLDITDGLRAIDEAVCFLNLEDGDRIGHALALRANPEQYYRNIGNSVMLPAQDLLDNLVWLLFRSMEFGVSISGEQRAYLREMAEQLLRDIYGDYCVDADGSRYEFSLRDYYQSWKLRGDDPSLYQPKCLGENAEDFIKRINLEYRNHYSDYRRAMLDERQWEHSPIEDSDEMHIWLLKGTEESRDFRAPRKWQLLLNRYHYGVQERFKGQRIECFQPNSAYMMLIKDMQDKMMEKLMNKGISIECNPSSNYLIGSFEQYDQHPIFRFNHFGLPKEAFSEQKYQMKVSINTDDLGVFDTSLESEYGLIWACLKLRKDIHGDTLIGDDSISIYLNHLREMGLNMTFPKATRVKLHRSHL